MALSRICCGAVLGCAVSLTFSGPAAADSAQAATGPVATQLAPHRAVYELTLGNSSGGKGPAGAHGRIAFDFTGSACDGYVQNFRQVTELQPPEGPPRLSDLRSATFEGADGRDFRFRIETRLNNRLAENIDGKAKKKSDALAIDLAKPKRTRLDLSGAVFPTEHLRRILIAAQMGEQIVETKVYDGSGDGSKIFDATAMIGKPATGEIAEKPAQAEQLKSLRRWPVAISYFDPARKDGEPLYVLSFDLFENGVSRALKLDYGDFVLNGEMTELTFLPATPCKK